MSATTFELHRRAIRPLLAVGLVIALVGVGGGVALRTLRKASQSSDTVGGLEVAPDQLNFGEVWENREFSWVVAITNHRGQEVQITKFRATCNCSKIEPPSLTIPAGQTREIRLTIDFAAKQSEETGSSIRDFEVEISPEIPDDEGKFQRISWKIRGRVRSAIQCDPPFVDLGRESELAQPLAPQRINVKCLTAIRNLSASCTPRIFYVQVRRRWAKESGFFDLVVTPREALPRGEIRCTIALIPELSDGRKLPAKQLPVVGYVAGDIQASPPSVLFGAQEAGTTAVETIALRSLTARSFQVLNARCEGVGLTIKRLQEAPSLEPRFRVKQKVIAAKGEQHAKAVFRIRSKGAKEEEIVVPVSYCGIKGQPD